MLFEGLRDPAALTITPALVIEYTAVHGLASLAFAAVLASWLLDTLRPWAIIGANFVATLVMLGILFRHHHTSLREVLTSGE